MTKNLKLDNIIVKLRMLSRHTAEIQWEDRSAHCVTILVVDFLTGSKTVSDRGKSADDTSSEKED